MAGQDIAAVLHPGAALEPAFEQIAGLGQHASTGVASVRPPGQSEKPCITTRTGSPATTPPIRPAQVLFGLIGGRELGPADRATGEIGADVARPHQRQRPQGEDDAVFLPAHQQQRQDRQSDIQHAQSPARRAPLSRSPMKKAAPASRPSAKKPGPGSELGAMIASGTDSANCAAASVFAVAPTRSAHSAIIIIAPAPRHTSQKIDAAEPQSATQRDGISAMPTADAHCSKVRQALWHRSQASEAALAPAEQRRPPRSSVAASKSGHSVSTNSNSA
jgi:hypothetical protein